MSARAHSSRNRIPWLKRPIVIGALVAGVLVTLRLLPVVAQVVLVIFGGLVMAVLLDGASSWIARHIHLPHWLAMLLFVLFCLAGLVAIIWLLGAQISSQFNELWDRVKTGVGDVEDLLRKNRWTRQLVPSNDGSGGGAGSKVWSRAADISASAFGALANALILLVIALYLAVDPEFYVRSVLRLAPPARRQRYGELAAALGSGLRWWFVGRFSSMAVIGGLTGVGLWIAGVPMAFPLGLIAGLFSFVPFVGPIVASIPGILVAWVEGPTTAVYAIVVYVVVQALEGNLITPLIQKRTVSVPPALLITGQLFLGSLFGFWGVIWATPLIVAAMVATRLLYVEDVLREKGDFP